MVTAHTVEAVEFGVRHALSEIRSSHAQIEGGKYPQFDHNCRVDISEWLEVLDESRLHQIELGGGPYSPLDLGLREDHLPGHITQADRRSWRRWVLFQSTTPVP